ncbi:SDR family NAD(P)-dependent oxidoreductase [Amycolatopsis sp. PS_44_ISF1]|uniref:SDR family NAD(P)-dependent oxidoreductase n=1 Tax=Amycolatopsis sp. PS_44_ISF1 TaxID=2974917 RepID=UPI0028E011BC|nr:SDR family NAD(P)-dependent oxidoreductase [Amycolatopsis sp. PS_44_ISF1]MDT8910100.1 SDR family oxidoreductase [Amycolatopsis sp. PS_44_ISF1]
MELGFKGKRALVTGGTRGIGRAVALGLASAGATVVAVNREDNEDAESLRKELSGLGGTVAHADVTVAADVARLAETCRTELGGLDVLVNNAGVHGHTPLAELDLAEWTRLIDTDLTSMFLVTQACVPLLAEGASVVNVGASAAFRGMAGTAHYTAAKAGVVGLTRSLCKEFGGIRVNTIAPGVIDTGDELPPPVAERVKRMTALGRLGTPEEVAGAVLFLAGDLSTYVTGALLAVDGGM